MGDTDRPLLEAVAKEGERGHSTACASSLFGTAGLPDGQVLRGLKALYQDGLVQGADASSHEGFDLLEIELAGVGRRAVGHWSQAAPTADR